MKRKKAKKQLSAEPITAFSKYLAYNVGGAEKSMLALLKRYDSVAREINIVSFSNVSTYESSKRECSFPKHWKKTFLRPVADYSRYAHYEYYRNNELVSEYFKTLPSNNKLHTYSLYAPAAINSFGGESKFYLRSETDLLVRENYYSGFRRLLKKAYLMGEIPVITSYRKELVKALHNSDVIANSNFMARLCSDLYSVQARVQYPEIDFDRLYARYQTVKNDVDKKGIVFVGDSFVKGSHIAHRISKLLPESQFYFFSRYARKEIVKSNVTIVPWKKDSSDIYKHASIVIVPSVWNEAYGRVARESYLLGLPTLVSNRGGLPEAVEGNGEFIVNNYSSASDWVKKLKVYI